MFPFSFFLNLAIIVSVATAFHANPAPVLFPKLLHRSTHQYLVNKINSEELISLVETAETDVLIKLTTDPSEIHHPITPVYENVAFKLKLHRDNVETYGVTLNKDDLALDIPLHKTLMKHVEEKGCPSLVYIPCHLKSNPACYVGDIDESSILNWVKTQSSNVDGYMKSNIDEHIHDNEYIGALEVAEKVMFDDDDDDDCDDSCLL